MARKICHGVEVSLTGAQPLLRTNVYVGGRLAYKGKSVEDGETWARGYCACSTATSAMFGLRRKSRRER